MNGKNLLKKYIRRSRANLLILLLIILSFSITELIAAYIMGVLVDTAVNQTFKLTVILSLCVLTNFAINSICRTFRYYVSSKIAENTAENLRNQIFNNIVNSKIERLPTNFEAEVSSIIMNDVNIAKNTISISLVNLIQEPITAILALFYISISIDWKIALIACLSAPITIVIGNIFGSKLENIINNIHMNLARKNKYVLDIFNGIFLIKSYVAEEEADEKFRNISKKVRKKICKQSYYEGLNEGLIIFSGAISYIGLYFLGGRMVSNGLISIGALVATFQLVSFITWPIAGFGKAIANFKSNIAVWNRISEVLSIEQENTDGELLKDIKMIEDIDFENLDFKYNKSEKYILKNINFSIKKGEIISIVGKNGSGKSTILKLLLKFYTPNSGNIKINKININNENPRNIRKLISYVSQESIVIDGTLKENILLGMDDKTDLFKYKKELEELELDNFIFDTNNEKYFNSLNLSGGFKQRLSLARAIVSDRPIVLIDEGTSNIDKISEKIISQNLKEWFKNKIVIIVAHGSIANEVSDRIFYLDRSKIREVSKNDSVIRNLLID